ASRSHRGDARSWRACGGIVGRSVAVRPRLPPGHIPTAETDMRCTSLSFLGLLAAATAQDLVLVDAQGAMAPADTNTRTVVRQGGGRAGMHGLATDGITLWSCANGRLVTIDRLTWAAVDVAPTVDYMSLAWDAGSSALYGVRLIAPGTSQVDRIDLAT